MRTRRPANANATAVIARPSTSRTINLYLRDVGNVRCGVSPAPPDLEPEAVPLSLIDRELVGLVELSAPADPVHREVRGEGRTADRARHMLDQDHDHAFRPPLSYGPCHAE